MIHDFLVCTNQINYSIAIRLVDTGSLRSPWILVDEKRCEIVSRSGVRQWHLSVSRWRWLSFWLQVVGSGRVGDVYIPHHALNRRAMALTSRALSVRYIDDGLDTRRLYPRNFDLVQLKGNEKYFTFDDYMDFPPWMQGFDIHRVASLHETCQVGRDLAAAMPDFDHLFVESPGCEIDTTVEALGISRDRVLVIQHPSPAKRQRLQPGYVLSAGRTIGTDWFVAGLRGKKIYFGETMSFFIALSQAVHSKNDVHLVLPPARRAGLHGLPVMELVRVIGGLELLKVVSLQ